MRSARACCVQPRCRRSRLTFRPTRSMSRMLYPNSYVSSSEDRQRAVLFKRPPEVREHPEGEQVDAQEGLNARHDTHPSRCSQRVLAGLEPRNPVSDIELAPTDLK